MRSLLPEPSLADVDLHAHYAAEWLERGGVRANFVSSIDGAISAQGLSGGLQTPGDNRVFAALRDLADVVLVGAGTAAAEGYGPVSPSGDRLAKRRELGLHDELPIALVSNSLHVDPADKVFTAKARTIVVTSADADAGRRRALAEVADVISFGTSAVDLGAALAALRERGLRRVLCEGGPTLFATLAGQGLVDELCLSISATLAGPGSGRLAAGTEWSAARPMQLRGLLEEDSALFCRYTAAGPTATMGP